MVQYDVINPKHFRDCMKDKKIILFGAGEVGKIALSDVEVKKRVIAVVDNSSNKWGSDFEGYVVESPEILLNTSCLVLITCQHIYDIVEQLTWLNVSYYFHYETIKHIENIGRDVSEPEGILSEEIQSCYKLWNNQNFYAHAMGTIDDVKYTNSKEAFIRNYNMGCRVFEVDMKQFEDGRFVACHGGDYFESITKCIGDDEKYVMKNTFNCLGEDGYPINSETFQKERVYGKYEVLFWEDIIEFMEKDTALHFLIDTKGVLDVYFDLIKGLNEQLRCRFIIQLGINQGEWVDKFRTIGVPIVHMIENYYCKLYERCTNNELISACLKNKVGVLTVGKRRLNANLVMLAKKHGIRLCAYNQVNSSETIRRLKDKGATIFCIDDYDVAKRC